GAAQRELIIQTDAGETVAVMLTAQGVSVTPSAEVSQVGNNLGGVAVGGTLSSPQIATIVNRGSQPLVISSIALVDGGANFSLTGIPADLATHPISLATGESFSLGATFTAGGVGLRRAVIEVATNDPTQPSLRLGAVATGLDGVVYPAWGEDFVAIEMPDRGGQVLRAKSDGAGSFSFFLPPTQAYHVVMFDPVTGLVAHGYGTTPPSGGGIDLTTDLVFSASATIDSDFDGLPDDVEFSIGTGLSKWDTDADGISDFTEIERGLDPLGGRGLPVGVVAGLDIPGSAHEATLIPSPVDPAATLALIASGGYGLDVIDVTNFQSPESIGRMNLSGDSLDVAYDASQRVAVVAGGSGGLQIVDVTDPTRPVLKRAIVLSSTGASRVETHAGLAYAASQDKIYVVDLASHSVVEFIDVGSYTIVDMAIEGDTLLSVDDHSVLHSFDISNWTPVARGSLTLPTSGGKMFLGGGVAYITVESGFQGGFVTVDVSNPAAMTLLSDVDDTAINGRAIAVSGSGLAVTVGSAGNLPPAADVVLVSDPTNTAALVTRSTLPSEPNGVSIGRGLAFVSDGAGGLRVVNFVAFDTQGVAPSVDLRTSAVDVDPGTAGFQVVEGWSIPVAANVQDDVQVDYVEWIVNGATVAKDVSFPFDFSAVAPTLASGTSTVTVRARAVDTGGNASLSSPLTFSLVPDTFAPHVVASSPTEGG
ncbi:MAG TPA: Ig-like domain-containing protein, partial [Pirellulaceae bacterium]|nr:Ig-like domain-containing protein [Pirellulaceae bacterium]